jgi:hypothetical protein
MYTDPIVDEIHQIRQQLLAQHQGDFAAYFASLLKAQQLNPQRYVSFAQPGNSLPHTTLQQVHDAPHTTSANKR